MLAIKIIVIALMLVNVTWVYYVAIIRLYRERATLNPAAKTMAYVGTLIGVPLDIFLNLCVTVLLLDWPHEITLSQRLSRLNDTGGWRGDVSRWICAELLDPFDPAGRHCK